MKITANQATVDTVNSIQETANKLRKMQRPYRYRLLPLFGDLPQKRMDP